MTVLECYSIFFLINYAMRFELLVVSQVGAANLYLVHRCLRRGHHHREIWFHHGRFHHAYCNIVCISPLNVQQHIASNT